MAWCHPGDKPLSEPMMVSLPMHICVTRPHWVQIIIIEYDQWCSVSNLLSGGHNVVFVRTKCYTTFYKGRSWRCIACIFHVIYGNNMLFFLPRKCHTYLYKWSNFLVNAKWDSWSFTLWIFHVVYGKDGITCLKGLCKPGGYHWYYDAGPRFT